tara:strand:+ start:1163 stop:1315 length:153 start_codon:yes stop_codon:yes gene_type:complete
MRPFKEILKDLEESGMQKISDKIQVESKKTSGVKNGKYSYSKWSSKKTTK